MQRQAGGNKNMAQRHDSVSPSQRMTTTSPAVISPLVSASAELPCAPGSDSKRLSRRFRRKPMPLRFGVEGTAAL